VSTDGETAVPDPESADDWSYANLWAGLKDVRTWVPLAARALVLDRDAYNEIVTNRRMTGPALLLGLLFSVLSGVLRAEAGHDVFGAFVYVLNWLFSILVIFVAGWLLTRKGSYTRTLRALGFAQVVHIVELVAFIPVLGTVAEFLSTIVTFVAVWMGAAAAHHTRGWRTIILPLLILLTLALIPTLLFLMFGGAAMSLESVLEQFGLVR